MKRSAIARRPRPDSDKVTPELRLAVFERDHFRCLAPVLDPDVDPAECRGKYGQRALIAMTPAGPLYDLSALTLDHVHDHAGGTLGKRAPSDAAHLATACHFHHVDSGWCTSHRGLLRDHLASIS